MVQLSPGVYWTAAVVGVFSATVVAGTGSSHAAEPAKVLKVCTTGDYRPLTYRDPSTGNFSGIDIDMARSFADYLDARLVFVQTSWPTLMDDITTQGKCDIAMGGISVTPQRQQQANFTQSYLQDGKTPITTSGNAERFQTLKQINRKDVKVIVNPGGTNAAFVKEHLPDATVITWPDNTTIFEQIIRGRADVMITDSIEAKYQASQNPRLVAVHPDAPFTASEKSYMLPKGSPLTNPADTWLTDALKDGTFQHAYDRWIHTSPTATVGTLKKYGA
ncbi:transporter substrate-binding domain-containing protein [Streptomyces kronopolitis]|uniref:transporter substrate-binding domain-containing protein n=1 Tax=Streptomyces kronopolitis TaxID=1612435 RepID=UPI003673D7D9